MPSKLLDFAQPFFDVHFVTDQAERVIEGRAIVLNLDEQPCWVGQQQLNQFQSIIAIDVAITRIKRCVIVYRFDTYANESALLEHVRATWPQAYEIRKEPRLKGVGHYMSPKSAIDNIQFSMYHAATVPLNVGLHQHHVHLGGEEPQEVHTQIVGLGKMQQCTQKDINTLFAEELMAPGTTHKPMFNEKLEYPWHQYETITPGIFMAIEILPSGTPISSIRT